MRVGIVLLLLVSMNVQADSLYMSTVSRHYMDNDQYNNQNWGVQLYKDEYVIGTYKNSFSDWVLLTGREFYRTKLGDVDVSLMGGVVVGYHNNPVFPAVAASIDYGPVRVVINPYVTNVSFRIAQW